jgi:hypothetical protein
MRWRLSTFQDSRIKEAALMLRIFKKFVDAHDFNFSSTEAINRLFWNYYRLKENLENKDHWKTTINSLSSNEISLEVLVEFYLQLNTILDHPLSKIEQKLLQKIIIRFYDQLKMTSNPLHSKISKFPFQLGHLGLHG